MSHTWKNLIESCRIHLIYFDHFSHLNLLVFYFRFFCLVHRLCSPNAMSKWKGKKTSKRLVSPFVSMAKTKLDDRNDCDLNEWQKINGLKTKWHCVFEVFLLRFFASIEPIYPWFNRNHFERIQTHFSQLLMLSMACDSCQRDADWRLR